MSPTALLRAAAAVSSGCRQSSHTGSQGLLFRECMSVLAIFKAPASLDCSRADYALRLRQ